MIVKIAMKLSQQKTNLFVVTMVFIVALFVSWNNIQVGFDTTAEYSSKYEHLYFSQQESIFNNRQCDNNINDMHERHRLRWVFWQIKKSIYGFSQQYFGYKGVGAAYVLIHSLFIVIAFLFTYKTTVLLLNFIKKDDNLISNSNNFSGLKLIVTLLFLVFFAVTFNGRVSEYTYSIIEAAFVSAAIYFSLKRKVLCFSIVVAFAVLNRESGFILILMWLLINKIDAKNLHKSLPLLLPVIVFSLFNYDVLHCLFQGGFLVTSSPQEGQLTYHVFFDGVSGIIKGGVVLIFNYATYLIPVIISYMKLKETISARVFTPINTIMLIILFYVFIFIIATPLNHMSVKFIIVPLIVPILSMYIVSLFVNNSDINK